MRAFLQQPAIGEEPPRYVQLILQPDLFGGWELLRESGQVGGRAQLRREQLPGPEEARRAFEKARDTQLRRGYLILSSDGAQPSY